MGPVVCLNIPTYYKTLQRIEKILLNSQAYLMALHKFQEGRLGLCLPAGSEAFLRRNCIGSR